MNPINYFDPANKKPDHRIIPKEDLSRIFIDSSEAKSRDPGRPVELANSVNPLPPEDLNFVTALSPATRYFPFSPVRGAGLSFYEAFTRKLDNKGGQLAESGQKTQRLEFKPFNRINNSSMEAFSDQPEKNPSTNAFNYLNTSNSLLRDIINESNSVFQESASPLRLELWKVDSLGQNPPASPPNEPPAEKPSPNFRIGLQSIRSQPEVAKPDPEILLFKNLADTLESLFVYNNVSAQMLHKLTKLDEEILNSLLQRKFGKRLSEEDRAFPPDKKADGINHIVNLKSQKRPEECYKFILTRVIKHLKKKLKDSPESPEDTEAFLYDLYFKDTAARMGLPITDFHYPLTGQRGKFKLNSVYFDKIFKSEKFLQAIGDYVNNVLYAEYKAEIAKKIESLLVRWDLQLQNPETNILELEKAITEYLLKNKRCKLPWTMKEVGESIERFVTLIKNYRSK